MIRRILLIGLALVGVWFVWALLPDVARSWKTREADSSEPEPSEPQAPEPEASRGEETPVS